jgi:hypothetical protein
MILSIFCSRCRYDLQVELMYRRCGFDVDPSASTLQMLTNIEMRLEDYLKQVCCFISVTALRENSFDVLMPLVNWVAACSISI